MLIEQPPQFMRRIWPAVWRLPKEKKCVYLTFDDGPNREQTPFVLDILEKYHIKATFFCVGDNVRKHPGMIETIRANGHSIGNHTMHHIRGFECSTAEYMADVAEAQGYLQCRLFRPPHGRITLRQLRALKKLYTVVMWDVITRDYNPKLTPEEVIQIVKRYTRNGSIITFHDSLKASKNMMVALEPSIQWLLEQGYEFKLIEEVI